MARLAPTFGISALKLKRFLHKPGEPVDQVYLPAGGFASVVIMQSTACNAVHSVEQRLARWLLLAHDRVGTDAFPLTQKFAAMMLGTSRPTVTVVAGTLQASCECYRAATDLLKAVTQSALTR